MLAVFLGVSKLGLGSLGRVGFSNCCFGSRSHGNFNNGNGNGNGK
jgi:hypothetical protein